MWWHRPVISVLRRLEQENWKFKAAWKREMATSVEMGILNIYRFSCHCFLNNMPYKLFIQHYVVLIVYDLNCAWVPCKHSGILGRGLEPVLQHSEGWLCCGLCTTDSRLFLRYIMVWLVFVHMWVISEIWVSCTNALLNLLRFLKT